MPKVNLTAGRIRSFTCPPDKAQAFLWDAVVPGLGVRATPSGTKAFVFQGSIDGKSPRITIGDARVWGIEAGQTPEGEVIPGAREEARRLQSLIDKGIDPRQEKADREAAVEAKKAAAVTEAEAATEQARRLSVTVGDAWGEYVKARSAPGPKQWGKRHLEAHEKMIDPGGKPKTRGRKSGESGTTVAGPLAALMPLPLAQLDADRAKTWLQGEAATRPTYAALAFRCLKAFVGWCAESPEYRGIVHPDACATKAAKAVLPKKKAKSDSLQREQLRAWFDAVRAHHNPVISAYLQALLLTGARREELAGLRWDDVDFRWNSLSIRDKVEGERVIPLTPYVAHLLAPLPRRNEWVFSSPTAASGRLQEPRIAHDKALKVAGLPSLSLHGLRRSFGTLSEWVEVPVGIVAQIQGHKPSATAEKHYRVRPLDLLRAWHTKIEAWILEQAGIEQPKEGEQGLRLVKIGK